MDPGDCPSGLAAPGQPLLKGEWFARPEGVFGDGAIGDALQADSVICEDFEPYNVLVQWDSFQYFPLGHNTFDVYASGSGILQDIRTVDLSNPGTASQCLRLRSGG